MHSRSTTDYSTLGESNGINTDSDINEEVYSLAVCTMRATCPAVEASLTNL